MQTSYTFDSGKPGKNILIIWSIHGDEICGSIAIERVREDILCWHIRLISGKITCIPYANHEAYMVKKRQITHNLNRIFWQYFTWGIYDTAHDIENHILQSDFVFDLHSFSAWIDPFIFNDHNTTEVNTIIRNIPIKHIMMGWIDLYAWYEEFDTIGFAKKHSIPGITIECGQHSDPNSIEVAYRSIIAVLHTLTIIHTKLESLQEDQVWISVDTIIRKKSDYTFSKEWKNFDPIKTNEPIGTCYAGKESILSPYDGIIIMPNSSVEDWWEWCYLGKIITYP